MTLLLSFMDIPLYKWGYDPISQILNQPSPTAREILGICFEILNIQQRKLWKISYLCGWYCLFSIHLVCSFLVCLVHVSVCSIVMHFVYVQYWSVED